MKANSEPRAAQRAAEPERREGGPFPIDRIAEEIDRHAWFLARVSPGMEFSVVTLMADRGLFAWTPTRSEWRRPNGSVARKRLRTFVAAPGYVVVAMPLEPAARRWHLVTWCPHVIEMMGASIVGAPVEIGPANVELIVQLSTEAEEHERFMRTRAEFRVGDAVRAVSGIYEGKVFDVMLIIEGRATVMADFCGAARRTSIPVSDLERVDR